MGSLFPADTATALWVTPAVISSSGSVSYMGKTYTRWKTPDLTNDSAMELALRVAESKPVTLAAVCMNPDSARCGDIMWVVVPTNNGHPSIKYRWGLAMSEDGKFLVQQKTPNNILKATKLLSNTCHANGPYLVAYNDSPFHAWWVTSRRKAVELTVDAPHGVEVTAWRVNKLKEMPPASWRRRGDEITPGVGGRLLKDKHLARAFLLMAQELPVNTQYTVRLVHNYEIEDTYVHGLFAALQTAYELLRDKPANTWVVAFKLVRENDDESLFTVRQSADGPTVDLSDAVVNRAPKKPKRRPRERLTNRMFRADDGSVRVEYESIDLRRELSDHMPRRWLPEAELHALIKKRRRQGYDVSVYERGLEMIEFAKNNGVGSGYVCLDHEPEPA